MATLSFDTLAFVKRLKAAGFQEDQAEAISDAVRDSQNATMENLATKEDIRMLQRDIKESEMRATTRVGAMMGAAILLVAALAKLL